MQPMDTNFKLSLEAAAIEGENNPTGDEGPGCGGTEDHWEESASHGAQEKPSTSEGQAGTRALRAANRVGAPV